MRAPAQLTIRHGPYTEPRSTYTHTHAHTFTAHTHTHAHSEMCSSYQFAGGRISQPVYDHSIHIFGMSYRHKRTAASRNALSWITKTPAVERPCTCSCDKAAAIDTKQQQKKNPMVECGMFCSHASVCVCARLRMRLAIIALTTVTNAAQRERDFPVSACACKSLSPPPPPPRVASQ